MFPYRTRASINPDGHIQSEGAWPADAYYGDVVGGTWTDQEYLAQRNRGPLLYRGTLNFPGDGKFDQNRLDAGRRPELWVGRVDLADLPAFWQSNEDPLDAEVRLLRDYLDKLHRYRHGQLLSDPQRLVMSMIRTTRPQQ
jgi:hypothetical protein